MGQQNSKDQLVYQQVMEGNAEAIKALCRDGVRLEWMDKEGKTPLIVASMDHRLYIVAKTLIELGANINAYRPGRHAGTPLHHAAKRGLDNTVKLLLSHGANPYLRNDDCQTPLDVARMKGYGNVVRTIEAHICYFSGEIREMLVAPGVLESLVPQRLSRKRSKKSWVVVVPCSLPNPRKPTKLELVVYSSQQDPQPSTVIPLWKCNIAEPKFHESDPALIVFDESTKTRHKFLSAIEGDRQQLAQLYSACKGLPKVMPSLALDPAGALPSSINANSEAVESATALNPSIHSANNQPELPSNMNAQPNSATNATNDWGDVADTGSHGGWGSSGRPPSSKTSCNGWADGLPNTNSQQTSAANATNGWGDVDPATHGGWGSSSRPSSSKANCNGWADEPAREEYNGWAVPGSRPTPSQSQHKQSQDTSAPLVTHPMNPPAPMSSAPSAPPLPAGSFDSGPIHYPAVDLSPVDFSVQAAPGEACTGSEVKDKNDESSCVICWEAPVEGACIPCGHMAGCMSCLTEIKSKKGDCPVCRAKINQVIKLYAV